MELTLILSVQLTKSVHSLTQGIQGYLLAKKSAKDRVIATVMRYTREGLPFRNQWNEMNSQEDYSIAAFKRVRDSLSTAEGCISMEQE